MKRDIQLIIFCLRSCYEFFDRHDQGDRNEYAGLVADGVEAGDVESFIDSGSYALNALLSGSIYGGLPVKQDYRLCWRIGYRKNIFRIGYCQTVFVR